MATNASIFLKVLHYVHYFVMAVYVLLFMGIKLMKDMNVKQKYLQALHTFYTSF